jgi:hypothetical protein
MLLVVACLYATAILRAAMHGGCCLIYQTERLHERISFGTHLAMGFILYPLLCLLLLYAAVFLTRHSRNAIVALLLALALVVNEAGGALFDAFSAMPWVPESGPRFEQFFNVMKIPTVVWYCIIAVLVLAVVVCVGKVGKRK